MFLQSTYNLYMVVFVHRVHVGASTLYREYVVPCLQRKYIVALLLRVHSIVCSESTYKVVFLRRVDSGVSTEKCFN